MWKNLEGRMGERKKGRKDDGKGIKKGNYLYFVSLINIGQKSPQKTGNNFLSTRGAGVSIFPSDHNIYPCIQHLTSVFILGE